MAENTPRLTYKGAEAREKDPIWNFASDSAEFLGWGKKALAPWDIDENTGTNVLGDTVVYHGKDEETLKSKANQAAIAESHARAKGLVGETSVKIDKETGKITVTAPKGVAESPEFSQAMNMDVLKQASQAYRLNNDYKVPYTEYNSETGETKETEITIPEYIARLNLNINQIAYNLITADKLRMTYANKWNSKAENLNDTQIRMSTDYKGKMIPIPKFVTSLSGFRGIDKYIKDGYIAVDDLKKFYNRDKLGRDELATIMASLETSLKNGTWSQDEYYSDGEGGEVFDRYNANEMARAIAFRDYIISNDPEQTWIQSVGENVGSFAMNAMYGADRVMMNLANDIQWVTTLGQGHEVQDYIKDMDAAFGKYNEQNQLVNDATATTAFFGQIGGAVGVSLALGKIAKDVKADIKGVSSKIVAGKQAAALEAAGIRPGSAAAEALTYSSMIEIAKSSENVGMGAVIALRLASPMMKASVATNVAKVFMTNHPTLHTAVEFLVDTLHDALLYDSVTLREAIESTDQDVKDYWMGQLAENGKYWIGLGAAKGLIKNAGKTSLGKLLDAKMTRFINRKAASIGDTWGSIKDKMAGGSLQAKLQSQLDDILAGNKASDARKAKQLQNKLQQLEFNQQLRNARRELGSMEIKRKNFFSLKLADDTAAELLAKKNAIRALDISVDAYNRNIQYKRQEMLGVIAKDPYTGMKNLTINPGLAGANAKASEFYFKLADMNQKAGFGHVQNSFLSQDVIDYLVGSYDLQRYSKLTAEGASEAAEIARLNLEDVGSRLPDNIKSFIDENRAVYTQFYDELNQYAVAHKLLDRDRLAGYKNETWDAIGGYQPVVVASDSAPRARMSIDTGGNVSAVIDQEMRELSFRVKEKQHYIDPELTRQSRINRIAQAEINRNMLDSYQRNTGATFSEYVTGNMTEYAQKVNRSRKFLESTLAKRSEDFVQDFNVAIRYNVETAAEIADDISTAVKAIEAPIEPVKPALMASNKQIASAISESMSADLKATYIENSIGQSLMSLDEDTFNKIISNLNQTEKKGLREIIRGASEVQDTYMDTILGKGDLRRNYKIRTSDYEGATGLKYKDAPKWLKPYLSEKNGLPLDEIGQELLGSRLGTSNVDADDILDAYEKILNRPNTGRGILDYQSYQDIMGNPEALSNLRDFLGDALIKKNYDGVWDVVGDDGISIREFINESVNRDAFEEYYKALDEYDGLKAEYDRKIKVQEAINESFADAIGGGEIKYAPYKNKVIKSSIREKVISEFTFDDTTDALKELGIIGDEKPYITSGVDADNFDEWYGSLNKRAKSYLEDQMQEDGGVSFRNLQRRMAFEGRDFEYGLRRAYLIGDTDFSKSGIINEAAKRLEDGMDAINEGVYALKAKNVLQKIEGLDSDGLVNDLMITYKTAVNKYIDEMTRSGGVKAAASALSMKSTVSDVEIEHFVLSQLKEKGRNAVMDSIEKELAEVAKGKNIGSDDLNKMIKTAKDLFDEYLDSRIDIDYQAIKSNLDSPIDAKSAYETARSIDEEIKKAAGEVSSGANTGLIMFVDGKGRQAYAAVDPAFASLYNRRYRIDGADASMMAKVNAAMSKAFRYGTTSVNLTSFGNQLFRDFGNAVMVGGSWKTIKSYADDMKDVFGEKIVEQIKAFDPDGYEMKQLTELAKQMNVDVDTAAVSRELMRGAAIAPSSTERTLYKELWKNLKKDENVKLDAMDGKLKQILEKYNPEELLNGKRENYLRNRVYAANLDDGLKSGYSLRDARILAEFTMNNATTNFSRQLYHLQSLAESTPYFRAAINGTKSFWRMWSLDPVGISGRITGGLIIPTMFLVGASLEREEDRKIYESIPEYKKQDSLVFVINGEIASVPMPQELSSIVAPFRQFVEYLNKSQKNNFWELMSNDLLSFLPTDLTGYTAIDMNAMSGDPTLSDRIGRGTARVFSQLAPVPVKTMYMLTTGIDPYTGKNLNDPSYWYWDDESGSTELMDYSQNRFARALADTGLLGKNAAVWEKVFSGIFGKTGVDVLDDIFELFMEGPDAAFKAFGENATGALASPFHQESYDIVDKYWKEAVRQLTAEKNAIIQNDRVKAINSELSQTKDPEKRKKLLAERAEFTNEYHKKVAETARRLTEKFNGTFDRFKFGAVVQLLNFNTETSWQAGSQESSDEASGSFYSGRDAAIAMMSQMGIETTNDLSVFGYVVKDENGNPVVKFNTPSTILDMKNTQIGESNFHLANIKSLVKQAGLYEKHSAISDQISKLYDKQKMTNADYEQVDAIKVNWNKEVAAVLADYIDKYSAEAAINNKQVRDFLKTYIEVPSAWEKNNKGKRVYSKTLGDRGVLADAYYTSWLRAMFGINDPYKGQY